MFSYILKQLNENLKSIPHLMYVTIQVWWAPLVLQKRKHLNNLQYCSVGPSANTTEGIYILKSVHELVPVKTRVVVLIPL